MASKGLPARIPGIGLGKVRLQLLADTGTKYQFIGSVPTLDQPSAEATLSVIAEWQAGAYMGNATSDVLGGHRLEFLPRAFQLIS